MWTWLRKIINWFLGIHPETPAEVSEVSAEVNKVGEKRLEPSQATLPETKIETGTYQEIDWVNNPPQYHKRKGVLSFPEREFYRLLRGQVGNKYHVFPMVRMADVLWLKDETENRKFFNNQIQCKHFDYVVCDKLKFEPVLVIELDDSSHQWPGRWRSDEFKDKVCKAAGLPLVRIKVQQDYDRAEIRKEIWGILGQLGE